MAPPCEDSPSGPQVRLEDVSMSQIHDFHKLWSNEAVALYSGRPVSDDFEKSREDFQRRFLNAGIGRPWIVEKAIVIPKLDCPNEKETAGFIGTVRPSPYGLVLAYHIQEHCWGRGIATVATKKFLKEYWSEPRCAPSSAVYAEYDATGNLSATARDQASSGEGEMVEIQHLVAEVDRGNTGSMRVAEKSGGRPVDHFHAKLLRFEGLRTHAVWQLDKP